MNRKLLLIILLAVLSTLSFPAYSNQSIINSMDFKGEGIQLNYNDALKKALNENPQILKAKIKLEQTKVNYEKNKSAINNLKESLKEREDSLEYFQGVEIPTFSNEYLVEDGNIEYETILNTQKASVEKLYFGLLQSLEQLEIEKENYNNANDLMEKVNKKFKLGLISRFDVGSAEMNVIRAQNSLKQTENSMKALKMQLNNILGHPLMQEIKPTEKLETKKYEIPEIANAVNSALKNRRDIRSLEYFYNMESMKLRDISYQYPSNTYKYKEQRLKELEAMKNLEMAKKQIEMEIRIKYMDVCYKKDMIISGEKTVKLSEENLKISKALFDKGLNTIDDIQKAQLSYKQAKLSLAQAVLDYNLAVSEFEDSIGVGRAASGM